MKKILIVEDFDDARELLAIRLKRLGFDVSEACDGIEALKQAAAVHPDLIIMDISMPRMDGLVATARLKADPATRDIPVVIATAHTHQALIASVLEAGALDVWVKPFNFTELAETLDRYMSSEGQANIPSESEAKAKKSVVRPNVDQRAA